jgi:hypothetical protein
MGSGVGGVSSATVQWNVEMEQKHDIGHVLTLHHSMVGSFVLDLNQRFSIAILHHVQVRYLLSRTSFEKKRRHKMSVNGRFTVYHYRGWSHWGSFGECSVTCGNGTMTRTRTCSNTALAHGGVDCMGSSTQNQTCIKPDCPSKTSFKIHGHKIKIHRITYKRIKVIYVLTRTF